MQKKIVEDLDKAWEGLECFSQQGEIGSANLRQRARSGHRNSLGSLVCEGLMVDILRDRRNSRFLERIDCDWD